MATLGILEHRGGRTASLGSHTTETDQEPVATQQLHQCLIPCLFAQYHPGCYHLGLDTGTQAHTHRQPPQTAIADVSGRHSHSPLPLGRRTSEAARNGWHRQDRLSPRNTPCHPAPVSGEAGKAVTVRALTGTTDETRTRPRAAVLDVAAHTRHGPQGHTPYWPEST